MLAQDTSQRICMMRFPLIVGVVFAHAYPGVGNNFISVFIYNFICNGLARIAVPLLFLISGYLFFINFDLSKQTYWSKFQARIGTLLIPFLIWNFATLLIFAFAQKISLTSGFFSGLNSPIAIYSSFDYFNAIFGINRMPIAVQFWFIRDLMVLVLLTPVIHYVNSRIPTLFLTLLFICWMLNFWPVYVPSVEAMLFFFIGTLLGCRHQNLFAMDKYGFYVLPIYLLVLVITSLFVHNPSIIYVHRIGILLGIVSAMFISKQVMKWPRLKDKLLELGLMSFFVFAAHEPLQIIIRKLVYKLFLPETWITEVALYFVIPISVIFILIKSYRLLETFTPNLLKTITGERTKS